MRDAQVVQPPDAGEDLGDDGAHVLLPGNARRRHRLVVAPAEEVSLGTERRRHIGLLGAAEHAMEVADVGEVCGAKVLDIAQVVPRLLGGRRVLLIEVPRPVAHPLRRHPLHRHQPTAVSSVLHQQHLPVIPRRVLQRLHKNNPCAIPRLHPGAHILHRVVEFRLRHGLRVVNGAGAVGLPAEELHGRHEVAVLQLVSRKLRTRAPDRWKPSASFGRSAA
mmetsp:Transcript_97817/g.282224  ORF Transcript_97817/g.282224 Transcript_97817/m.282224 type:complete len:220 (+) Transcript_97817:594-1253(+)